LQASDNFIRIAIYLYIMPKQKITISLDSDIAKQLRIDSIEKYGDARSLSRLIEDLATGAAEAKQPEACSILGHRTDRLLKTQARFNEAVKDITAQLSKIELPDGIFGDHYKADNLEMYFLLKDACELRINHEADMINACWSCKGLNGPLPKYPAAGKSFELFVTMDGDGLQP
jgi:hypothetical protein